MSNPETDDGRKVASPQHALWYYLRNSMAQGISRNGSDEATQTCEAIKKALRERFEPSSKQEVYTAEFENRRKRKTESWGDFGDELLRLVDKAFPNLQFEGNEQLALSHYLSQLEPMQVSFGVKQRSSDLNDEAVSSTLELESYLAAKPRSESISHVTVTDEPPAESIQAVQRDMIGAMQKLVERVEKLEVATKQRYPIGQGPRRGMDMPPRQSRGSKWNSGGQIVCRRCHQPGHYARGCAANMNPPGPRGQDTPARELESRK